MNKIDNFWKWFSSIAAELSVDYENITILDELDQRISNLGEFSWEIGPGVNEPNCLVISPNGDLDQLEKTKYIVSQAPKIKNWELFYSKQPKQWDFVFEIEVNNKIETIDASQWKYTLFKYPDQIFDILIESPQLNQFNEDDKIFISEIALDGTIGEESRITFIDNIEVVVDAGDYKSQLTQFIKLKDHLESLLGSV
jgi:hypothetical protein